MRVASLADKHNGVSNFESSLLNLDSISEEIGYKLVRKNSGHMRSEILQVNILDILFEDLLTVTKEIHAT